MSEFKESRMWQTIGLISCATGTVLLFAVFKVHGFVSPDMASLAVGLAASFIVLAGFAGFVFGRVMNAFAVGYNHREAVLWRVLGTVASGAGAIGVVRAATESARTLVTLDNLTMGLAGAFVIMVGVIGLLGNRVMYSANKHLVSRVETAREPTPTT